MHIHTINTEIGLIVRRWFGEICSCCCYMHMKKFHETTYHYFSLSLKKGVNNFDVLGPKLFFVTGLVIYVTAAARLVCPDLLG